MSNDRIFEELVQLRRDMNELKAEFNRQIVVNEELIRRAMNKDYRKMRRRLTVGVVAIVCATPLQFFLMGRLGMPLWFTIFTVVFFLSGIVFNLYTRFRYMNADLLTGELVRVASDVISYKHALKRWYVYAAAFVFVWYPTFMCLLSAAEDLPALVGGLVGIVLGAFVCAYQIYKDHKQLNNILRQIEEFRGEILEEEVR